jgi:glutamyl-tRNA reductase
MKKLNEKLNKSELNQVKSAVKKEIKKLKEKELEKLIKKLINKEIKDLNDLNKNFDKNVEEIFKTLLQNYHELFYREKHFIKNKLNYKK